MSEIFILRSPFNFRLINDNLLHFDEVSHGSMKGCVQLFDSQGADFVVATANNRHASKASKRSQLVAGFNDGVWNPGWLLRWLLRLQALKVL